ncbi:tRNA lysidine(34) synthetase TilS [Parapedobacter deserti]|uniref:tRNA(Ile)-lysidine synthase n=1 Tax=Parapedobacter deserti TaxID=1912957 RepID=A0ABV7JN52_9SPHI
MSIPERFVQYLREQALCQPHERILLAVSGGKDSVLMAHLFAEAGYSIGIAHCNFRLRGIESDADQALVYELARQLDVPFFTKGFDTAIHAQSQGISIQMAARDLRYEWFELIRATGGYDYIAVGQHRNDHVETLLLNLVRGTGLAGLRGIRPKRDRIIRPLLFLDAEEVATYVQERQLAYRDDSSNLSTKYARNKIRMEVIPRLKELNPDLERAVSESMERLANAHSVLQEYVAQLRCQLLARRSDQEWHIPIDGLLALNPRRFLMYELLRPFGFSEAVLGDLERALPGTSGKRFSSARYVIHVDRDVLILRTMEMEESTVATVQNAGDTVSWCEYRFESGWSTDTAVRSDAHMAQLDASKVIFPVRIRAWQEGDAFQPLGMGGRKKLSDLFVSLKIPVHRKHKVPVVVNGNGDILWVVPYRIDDRYKITAKTKKVFTLACF